MKRLIMLALAAQAFRLWAGGTDNLRLVKAISLPNVEGRIDHMASDPAGQRLFIAGLGNDTVEVVDLKAGQDIRSLPGFDEPQGIVYVPELKRLFVANGSDGTCRILDGRSFKSIRTVVLGGDADNVRYDPQSQRVYVGYGSGALGVLDAKNGDKVADIKLPGHPESFRLETLSSRIFINVPSSGEIAIVDRQKYAATVSWRLTEAQANFPMSLDEGSQRLFIGCRRPAKLLVMDAARGSVKAALPISGDTDDLFYDSVKRRIYVSCGEGFIDVVQQTDADHYRKLESIATASGARTSLFIPELRLFCLAVPARANHVAQLWVYQSR